MIKNKEARRFISESNVLAPILNLINAGNDNISNDWFDITADLCQMDEFISQYLNLENLDLLMGRALLNTSLNVIPRLYTFMLKITKNPEVSKKFVTKTNV